MILLATMICNGQSSSSQPKLPRMAYILQAEKLHRERQAVIMILNDSDRDWIVLDSSYDGSKEGHWTQAEIARLKIKNPERRILAYLSIGEAENYRSYWQREWDADGDGKPDKEAPDFICHENPEWKGNYKVRYWRQEWQELLLSRINRIIDCGFDGLYLDIVDAFEFFEYDPEKKDWIDEHRNHETGNTYRLDMIELIKKIARHTRQKKPQFMIVPQNGVQLLDNPDYVNLISAVGVEDLFTKDDDIQAAQETKFRLGFLKHIQQTDKPVLLVEYCTGEKACYAAVSGARRYGFSLLITDRELTKLGRNVIPKKNRVIIK